MATLPTSSSTTGRGALRLRLRRDRDGRVVAAGAGGAWWPRSRDLQRELCQLVDAFPADAGRIDRLLFSRPDWDEPTTVDGRGVRRIQAARGPVKTGSFPSDDTRSVTLVMSDRSRIRIDVIASSTDPGEAARLLGLAGSGSVS